MTKTKTGDPRITFDDADIDARFFSSTADNFSISNGGSGTAIDTTNPWNPSGNTVPTPYTTVTPSQYTFTPASTITTIGSVGVSTQNNKAKRGYAVFELPLKDKIPNKVYVSGRLLTVGILGSDVQAAFNGSDKLIFDPAELNVIVYNSRITLSLDYGDWLYHYNVGYEYGNVVLKEDSNTMEAKLVSKVAQK